jgi:GNAT superfamily N-acetyltransferase
MNIRVRAFRGEDADTVNRITVAAYEQYRNEFANWAQVAAYFAETTNLANEVEFLIAEGTQREILGVVGYVAPNRPRDNMFEPEWAVIRRLAVDPKSQGRGVGRHLTAECISRARDDGAIVIALHTSPVLEVAFSMYARLGFSHHRDTEDVQGVPYGVYTLVLRT